VTTTTTVVRGTLGTAMVAAIQVSSERSRVAAPQYLQDGVLGRCHPCAPLAEQRGPEPANDVAQRGRVPGHVRGYFAACVNRAIASSGLLVPVTSLRCTWVYRAVVDTLV
jgi:hypothetical protein